jgi:hypothetical protein
MVSRIFRIAVPLLLAFVAITAWALEWSGVGVLATRMPDGEVRTTRVWYVHDEKGNLLIEAGGPASPWLGDVKLDPAIRFEAEGQSTTYRAFVRPNPDGNREIRERLREKYGVRDVWVGLFFDSESTFAVALVPSEELEPGTTGSSLLDQLD